MHRIYDTRPWTWWFHFIQSCGYFFKLSLKISYFAHCSGQFLLFGLRQPKLSILALPISSTSLIRFASRTYRNVVDCLRCLVLFWLPIIVMVDFGDMNGRIVMSVLRIMISLVVGTLMCMVVIRESNIVNCSAIWHFLLKRSGRSILVILMCWGPGVFPRPSLIVIVSDIIRSLILLISLVVTCWATFVSFWVGPWVIKFSLVLFCFNDLTDPPAEFGQCHPFVILLYFPSLHTTIDPVKCRPIAGLGPSS